MVDTAGTLCKAAEVLKEFGARRVFAFASHGVFSGPAPTRIANSVLTELVVLDTVPLSEESAVSQFCFILFIFVFIFVVITFIDFFFTANNSASDFYLVLLYHFIVMLDMTSKKLSVRTCVIYSFMHYFMAQILDPYLFI